MDHFLENSQIKVITNYRNRAKDTLNIIMRFHANIVYDNKKLY